MAEPIVIRNAPLRHRALLSIGDKKGNANGLIDTPEEAEAAMAACQQKYPACDDLKTFIESRQFQVISSGEKPKNKQPVDFKSKLEEARAKQDPYYRCEALQQIAIEMAKTGADKHEVLKIFREAVEAARIADVKRFYFDRGYRSNIGSSITMHHYPLPSIAYSMVQAGLDKTLAFEIFKESLSIVRAIKDPHERSIALSWLAEEIVLAGMNWNESSRISNEALSVARKIKVPENKSNALLEAADAMAGIGMGKIETLKIFKEALTAARRIKDKENRSEAFKEIAEKMAGAGFFKEALVIARSIKDSGNRASALNSIADNMGFAEENRDEVLKIFQEAILAAEAIKTTGADDSYCLEQIVKNMSEAHFISEAIEVARKIATPYFKMHALIDTAKEISDKNESLKIFREALTVALTFKKQDDKDYAIRDIVSTMKSLKFQQSEINKLLEGFGVKPSK